MAINLQALFLNRPTKVNDIDQPVIDSVCEHWNEVETQDRYSCGSAYTYIFILSNIPTCLLSSQWINIAVRIRSHWCSNRPTISYLIHTECCLSNASHTRNGSAKRNTKSLLTLSETCNAGPTNLSCSPSHTPCRRALHMINKLQATLWNFAKSNHSCCGNLAVPHCHMALNCSKVPEGLVQSVFNVAVIVVVVVVVVVVVLSCPLPRDCGSSPERPRLLLFCRVLSFLSLLVWSVSHALFGWRRAFWNPGCFSPCLAFSSNVALFGIRASDCMFLRLGLYVPTPEERHRRCGTKDSIISAARTGFKAPFSCSSGAKCTDSFRQETDVLTLAHIIVQRVPFHSLALGTALDISIRLVFLFISFFSPFCAFVSLFLSLSLSLSPSFSLYLSLFFSLYIYICCRVKNWSKIWGF